MRINVPSTVPRLRAARFEDYGGIRQLALEHSVSFPSLESWEHRWRDNPVWQRLGDHCPIGWVLENAEGQIVGSMESVPTLYKFRGAEFLAAASSLWCVSAPYRGFALQLMLEYFNQSVDLLVISTASSAAIATVSQLFDRVPVGRWDTTSCCIGHFRLFAKQSLEKLHVPFSTVLSYPVAAVLRLTQAAGRKPRVKPPRGVVIETVDTFDTRFDVFWNELVRLNPQRLLAERSSRALMWHFWAAMRAGQLWILTASKNQRLIGYCTFLAGVSADGFKRLRLIDYQSIDDESDLLSGFIGAALARCAAEGFYVLDHVAPGLPRMRAFDECASYERSLGTWMALFHASNPELDAELHQPQFWDPSLFDGDATLC